MIDSAIRHVGDVQQTIDSTEVHEGAVIGDVLDGTVHDRPFGDHLHGVLALALALLLQQHSARENDVTALLVELDDLEVVGLTNHTVQVLHWTQVHLRTWKEGFHTNVNTQATLDAGNNKATYGFVSVHCFRDLVPSLHKVGLLLGETQRAGFLGHAVQVHIDGVIDLNVQHAVNG